MSKIFEDKINQLEEDNYKLTNEIKNIKKNEKKIIELENKYNSLLNDAISICSYISHFIEYKKNVYEHNVNCDLCKNKENCQNLYYLEFDDHLYSDEELFEFKKNYLDSFKEKYK